MKVTTEQKQVLQDLTTWIKNPDEAITLGGYAGTGKTTLISVWRKILKKVNPKMRVAFCAYTGKATRVMATQLNFLSVIQPKDSVSTIHSLIYAPLVDNSGGVVGWKRKSNIATDLLIVDEASMVDEMIWHDMTSFEVPILAVGDHGQLPPIGGNFNLMKKPDLLLNTIHRQAAENPIIQLSMQARETGVIEDGTYDGRVKKMNKYAADTASEVDEVLQSWSDKWMVLTGYNASRIRLNQQIRQHRQMEGMNPRAGDQVICLKNNWEKGIYNGMTGTLQRIIPIEESGVVEWYEVEILLEDGQMFYEGRINAHQFNQAGVIDEKDGAKRKAMGDLFDFGYALTVHKAQGSQSENVLLFEERNKYMTDDDWRRWLYTGVTRAEAGLIVVGG